MNTRATVPIAILTLGGTIAMTKQHDGTATPTLSAEDLLANVPELAETGTSIEVHNFRQLPGASLGFADLVDLSKAITKLDVAGIVITQGTDTIEETSFLLDLLHSKEVPVVVTGAMRNPSMAGADGPANLLAAVRVAASPAARGLGCVVVFGEEIHAAQWVRKTHTTSLTAFTSYPGPIGYVAEDQVVLWTRPQRRPAIDQEQVIQPAQTAVAFRNVGISAV